MGLTTLFGALLNTIDDQIYAKKRTRRQRFLDEMENTVPWEAFLALIQPVPHKPSSKGGRPPIPLELMLIDTPCLRRFAGIETMEGKIPDETTIINAPSSTSTRAKPERAGGERTRPSSGSLKCGAPSASRKETTSRTARLSSELP